MDGPDLTLRGLDFVITTPFHCLAKLSTPFVNL
nr:MAG TPA: hypothetical protein [Caudoviricetes sp.]